MKEKASRDQRKQPGFKSRVKERLAQLCLEAIGRGCLVEPAWKSAPFAGMAWRAAQASAFLASQGLLSAFKRATSRKALLSAAILSLVLWAVCCGLLSKFMVGANYGEQAYLVDSESFGRCVDASGRLSGGCGLSKERSAEYQLRWGGEKNCWALVGSKGVPVWARAKGWVEWGTGIAPRLGAWAMPWARSWAKMSFAGDRPLCSGMVSAPWREEWIARAAMVWSFGLACLGFVVMLMHEQVRVAAVNVEALERQRSSWESALMGASASKGRRRRHEAGKRL